MVIWLVAGGIACVATFLAGMVEGLSRPRCKCGSCGAKETRLDAIFCSNCGWWLRHKDLHAAGRNPPAPPSWKAPPPTSAPPEPKWIAGGCYL